MRGVFYVPSNMMFKIPFADNYFIVAECNTRSIFKWSTAGSNSVFSFSQISCLTKAKEPSLPYYLPIAGEKTDGFLFFQRSLAGSETQIVSSRIWTLVVNSIYSDNNHYAKPTSYTSR